MSKVDSDALERQDPLRHWLPLTSTDSSSDACADATASSPIVPRWALSAFFFCTSYHTISKRFLTLAWALNVPPGEDPLGIAAATGVLVNATLCIGTLAFSCGLDYFRNYYSLILAVMGAAACLAVVAWITSSMWPIGDVKLQLLVLGVVLLSAAAAPLRDAMTARLVRKAQQEGSTQAFGKHRLFVVLGQMVIAFLTTKSMALFGPSGCLGVLAAFLAATGALYATTFRGAAEWYARQVCEKEQQQGPAAPASPVSGAQGRSRAKLLDFAMLLSGFLCVGIATGLVEVILFPRVHQLGVPLYLLGLAHMVAAGTEAPVFYFEHRLVRLCGSYEGTVALGCMAMFVRLGLLSAFVVNQTATPRSILIFIFTESLHGFSRAPIAFSTAHLASETAPAHLKTTVQGVLNVACGFGGTVIGCLFVRFGLGRHGVGFLFAAAAFVVLLAAGPVLCFRLRRKECSCSEGAAPVRVRKLVIVVRADPVVCGHSTEARNLAEAAAREGTEVHLVTWPLEVLKQAGLPLKSDDEPYSPGIFVHRPEAVGDDKVLDGKLLHAMSGTIVDVLAGDEKLPGKGAPAEEDQQVEEVDVIITFYLVPHAQAVLQAANALETLRSAGAYNRRLITIGKAVGSDITSQVAACLQTGKMGSAATIFSQYLQHDILQAVSVYTKDFVLECAEQVDEKQRSNLHELLNERIEISYPPIDTSMYASHFAWKESAMALSHEVCAKYNVHYDRFVLYMSRVHAAKGVDDLVEAYQASKVRANGLPLLICGAGPFLPAIKEMCASDELIHVVGAIPESDKASLLHACSAFCLPSKPTPSFIETFGIAIAEKMLAGGPGVVVSTLCGGIPEATGGPTRSVVVEYSNPKSIKEGLERAVFMPQAERSQMAANAAEYALRFDRKMIWEETAMSVGAHVQRQRSKAAGVARETLLAVLLAALALVALLAMSSGLLGGMLACHGARVLDEGGVEILAEASKHTTGLPANAYHGTLQDLEKAGLFSKDRCGRMEVPPLALEPWWHDIPSGGGYRTHAYSNVPLEGAEQQPAFETAVISAHSVLLDAGAYFCRFFSALRSNPAFAGDAQGILVVAPRLDVNYLPAMATQNFTDMHFDPGHPAWAAGSHSKDSDRATTFDTVDAIVQLLRGKAAPGGRFPNLKQVVILGHSGSASWLARHALASKLPLRGEGPAIRWIIANPSNFVYFDHRRWAYKDAQGPYTLLEDPAGGNSSKFFCQLPKIGKEATFWNEWLLGVEENGGMPGHLRNKAALAEAVRLMAQRDVTVFTGRNDTCNFTPDADPACPTLLQGPSRHMRAKLYQRYLRKVYKKDVWRWHDVAGVGHCEQYMYGSTPLLEELFRFQRKHKGESVPIV